jgi:phage terminase small subunit
MRKRRLTLKQEVFVREYLIDLDAAKAVIRAGYHATGQRAAEIGYQLLQKAPVREQIQAEMDARSRRTHITADQVVTELARVAFVDMSRIVRFEGGKMVITETKDLTEDERRALSEMSESVTENGHTRKVKVHDKLKALELLGRHLGMWKDKVELSGEVTLGSLLAQAKDEGK